MQSNREKVAVKKLNLALQGGGSHGAFTWGVLDALLESGQVQLCRISGTSAGAMNAVVLAAGFAAALPRNTPKDKEHQQRCQNAREKLNEFWGEIGRLGDAMLMGPWTVSLQKMIFVKQMMSPYEMNRLTFNNKNVLQDTLKKVVGDFKSLHVQRNQENDSKDLHTTIPQLILCATDVLTGMNKDFKNYPAKSNGNQPDLVLEAVMASACLPTVFETVQIGNDYYWDGGYSSNPALFPLVQGGCEDVLLVQINPIHLPSAPTSLHGIQERMSQLTFNSKLVSEEALIDVMPHLLDSYANNQFLINLINDNPEIQEILSKKLGMADKQASTQEHKKQKLENLLKNHQNIDVEEYMQMTLYKIDGGAVLNQFDPATKLQTNTCFLEQLKSLGYQAGKAWLADNLEKIGQKTQSNTDTKPTLMTFGGAEASPVQKVSSKNILAYLEQIKISKAS